MEILFLGTGTSTGVPSLCCSCEVCQSEDARNKRLRSSILVRENGHTILVDTSTDLRQQCLRYDIRKIAILDTDAHHGDGTWNIFEQDNDVLYSCFCREGNPSINNNFDIELPQSLTDESYLALVESEFISGLSNFKPSAIFWNFGYDGTLGDYGDLGITRDFHVALAKLLKKAADQLCSGRLLVVLCGGSNRQTANQVIPRIIEVLIG